METLDVTPPQENYGTTITLGFRRDERWKIKHISYDSREGLLCFRIKLVQVQGNHVLELYHSKVGKTAMHFGSLP